MEYFRAIFESYSFYLPFFVTSLVLAFLLTPLVGNIAKKLGIVDLPADRRDPDDESKKTRVHEKTVIRAGGFVFLVIFVLITVFTQTVDKQLFAIILGVSILGVIGLLDDRFELSGKYQLVGQFVAAVVVVAAGISIEGLNNPASGSSEIGLRLIQIPFTIGSTMYSIALPADIITIIWLMLMTNAINWIFGTDGLGEGITSIAFFTILLVSVEAGSVTTALLATIALGSILGFLPFNIHPAKILSGTASTVYGFLIGVLSILGGVKVPSVVIVLIIPLIDMLWVMIGRINRKGVKNLIDVIKVTTTGDDTHLHHRLLKLGFSQKAVALIEWIAVTVCAVIAFLVGGLPKAGVIGILGLVVLTAFFVIGVLVRNGIKSRKKDDGDDSPDEPSSSSKSETPESKYAY